MRPGVPLLALRSLAELPAVLAHLDGPVLVSDLDNTLAVTGGGVPADAAEAMHALAEVGVTSVWIVTNRRPGPWTRALPDAWQLVAAARKPWTRRRRLPDAATVRAVLGDQLLLDGALAWRLGVPLLWFRPATSSMPWPSQVLNQLGWLLIVSRRLRRR